MNVRQKISLLITAAGLLSSLVFSCIIFWEMIEQPFRIIDSELEATAQRAVHIVLRREKNGGSNPDAPLNVGDDRYWLKIYDQNTGQPVYQSRLATLIDIPEPAPGSSATINVIIPRGKIHLGQDRRNEATFRVKGSKIVLDGRTFLVCVGRPMEKLEEEIWDIVIGVVSGLALSVLLLIAISYFVAGFILKPVRIINDQARDITEKHLDRRIPVSGDRDEFNALAQTLNQVFDRLQHAFLRQKRLLADASHELKTPLTMMRLSLDEIRSTHDENPSRLQAERLAKMTEHVLRMERLVKNLLDLSSLEMEGTTIKDTLDVAEMLASLIADYRFLADTRKIQIEARLPRKLLAKGNPEKLNRAFSNILDNAIKYNVDGGRVEVIIDQSGVDLTISVINTGPGVAEAEIPKVFDQFYRVEESRSLRYGGSGLGLAIVKRIVELHGGKVKFESQQGDWTRVIVSLPWKRETISAVGFSDAS
jgi:two-component system OmpR family sensor kinase